MQQFEQDYQKLVSRVLAFGEHRETRNGTTKSLFAQTLVIPMQGVPYFPLIQGRQMYYKGVLGEYAAMIRRPKHIKDFEDMGCNYWKQWAKPDGSINIDYGNAWFRHGQIEHLKECLANNHTDRRMLINGWEPENLKNLDLPCCHYSYQFYVREGMYLDMIWNQRSADVMIGIPSDIIIAATWLISLASEFGYQPGFITMHFGDTHIYTAHEDNAIRYCQVDNTCGAFKYPEYAYLPSRPNMPFEEFEPRHLAIGPAEGRLKLKFELFS